jgi:hypothetical protein
MNHLPPSQWVTSPWQASPEPSHEPSLPTVALGWRVTMAGATREAGAGDEAAGAGTGTTEDEDATGSGAGGAGAV